MINNGCQVAKRTKAKFVSDQPAPQCSFIQKSISKEAITAQRLLFVAKKHLDAMFYSDLSASSRLRVGLRLKNRP